MNAIRLGMLSIVLLVVGAGCQNKVAAENKRLWAENRALRDQAYDLQSQLKSAPDAGTMQQMQADLAARDAQIMQLQDQLRKPAEGQGEGDLAGITVTRDERAGTMTVNLPGDILFASGSATLKESAKATLNRIIGALKKDYAGKKVMVDGHTDSDPISKTKDKWKDNLDLSADRARTVSQYLVSQGLDGKLVEPRAFGPTSAKDSKGASRRVEIVVATR